MKTIIIGIIHSIYIIFILNFFKTKYSLAHPMTYFSNKLIYHPIGISDTPRSNVCKLGHILSYYLAAFILIRSILIYNNKYNYFLKNSSLIVLVLGIILSMLNFNVVVYLIPHFIIEILYIKYNFFYI